MATGLHPIVLGGLLVGALDIVAAFVVRNAFEPCVSRHALKFIWLLWPKLITRMMDLKETEQK